MHLDPDGWSRSILADSWLLRLQPAGCCWTFRIEATFFAEWTHRAENCSGHPARVDFLFFAFDLDALMLDVEPQASIDTHVLVCNPNKRKPGDYVAAPIPVDQLVMGNDQKQQGYVVAEAVFTGENVKEFSLKKTSVGLAILFAVRAWLVK
jgi:hypothetical protein